jgi:hypothetical protein
MRGVSGDDPEGGAGSGVPRLRREPYRGRSGPRPPGISRPGAGSRCGSGVPLSEMAAWVPGRKSPRWSAERGPGRTGTGPRLGSAGVAPRKRGKKERVRLSALHSPLVRGNGIAEVGIAAVAKVTAGFPTQASAKAEANRKDKPGRENAPRERRRLRCLTS